jgi:hypothetical protein
MVRVELLWSPTVICSNLATKKFWNILVLISLTFILNLVMVSRAEAYCIQNHPQGGRRPQMVQQTLRTSAVACGGWWFLRIKCLQHWHCECTLSFHVLIPQEHPLLRFIVEQLYHLCQLVIAGRRLSTEYYCHTAILWKGVSVSGLQWRICQLCIKIQRSLNKNIGINMKISIFLLPNNLLCGEIVLLGLWDVLYAVRGKQFKGRITMCNHKEYPLLFGKKTWWPIQYTCCNHVVTGLDWNGM